MKLDRLEQEKKDILKALKGINKDAYDKFIVEDAKRELAKAEEELRELKRKEAESFLDKKEEFTPNQNPKSQYLNPREQRENSFFKRLARFEHYNTKK